MPSHLLLQTHSSGPSSYEQGPESNISVDIVVQTEIKIPVAAKDGKGVTAATVLAAAEGTEAIIPARQWDPTSCERPLSLNQKQM